MNIQIRAHDLKLTQIQLFAVERQLLFALARFGSRLGRVILRLSDADGHHGGVHKRCQIEVGMRPKSVHIEHTHPELLVAVNQVPRRAARSVARTLGREHRWGS